MTEQRPLARWRARWARLSPLGRDITIVLVVKLAALSLLWWAFFSHPVTRHAAVDFARGEAHAADGANPEQAAHAHR